MSGTYPLLFGWQLPLSCKPGLGSRRIDIGTNDTAAVPCYMFDPLGFQSPDEPAPSHAPQLPEMTGPYPRRGRKVVGPSVRWPCSPEPRRGPQVKQVKLRSPPSGRVDLAARSTLPPIHVKPDVAGSVRFHVRQLVGG